MQNVVRFQTNTKDVFQGLRQTGTSSRLIFCFGLEPTLRGKNFKPLASEFFVVIPCGAMDGVALWHSLYSLSIYPALCRERAWLIWLLNLASKQRFSLPPMIPRVSVNVISTKPTPESDRFELPKQGKFDPKKLNVEDEITKSICPSYNAIS